MDRTLFVPCEVCEGAGRIITDGGVGYDRFTGCYPIERDRGECRVCHGTGFEEVPAEPVTEAEIMEGAA